MLTTQELRDLSQTNAWRSSLSIAIDYALIAAALAVYFYEPSVLTFCFAFLFIGRQQLALAILMHDGAHRRLYKSAAANDYISQFLLGAPLLFSMYSYKHLHLKHHQDPLVADDPDISLIGGYPISKMSFARKLLRDASGFSYFKFIRYFIHMARKPKSPDTTQLNKPTVPRANDKISFPVIAASIVIMQALLLSVFIALGSGWMYLALWILPAITVLQVLLRIRGVAEHAGYQPNPNQMVNARTVINPIQTFLFAPHNVNYHIEHHVYPSIPYFNLPQVHQLLRSRGSLPDANIFYGYRQVLSDIIR